MSWTISFADLVLVRVFNLLHVGGYLVLFRYLMVLGNSIYERSVVGAEKTTVTQRMWEIRIHTILKLDRAGG